MRGKIEKYAYMISTVQYETSLQIVDSQNCNHFMDVNSLEALHDGQLSEMEFAYYHLPISTVVINRFVSINAYSRALHWYGI